MSTIKILSLIDNIVLHNNAKLSTNVNSVKSVSTLQLLMAKLANKLSKKISVRSSVKIVPIVSSTDTIYPSSFSQISFTDSIKSVNKRSLNKLPVTTSPTQITWERTLSKMCNKQQLLGKTGGDDALNHLVVLYKFIIQHINKIIGDNDILNAFVNKTFELMEELLAESYRKIYSIVCRDKALRQLVLFNKCLRYAGTTNHWIIDHSI